MLQDFLFALGNILTSINPLEGGARSITSVTIPALLNADSTLFWALNRGTICRISKIMKIILTKALLSPIVDNKLIIFNKLTVY